MNAWLRLLILPFLLGMVLPAPASNAAEVPGVRAEYFNYSGSSTPSFPGGAADLDRIESQIKFFERTSAPAAGINTNKYLIRYTGYMLIPTTGTYTFGFIAGDGVRFYFDCDGSGDFQSSELLVDHWVDQTDATYTSACTNDLNAGQRYKFRYEYYQNNGLATAYLRWQGPSPVGSTMHAIETSDGTRGLIAVLDDPTPPTISSASALCTNMLVDVVFSEQVGETTSQTAANYGIVGGPSVASAVLQDDKRTVRLTLSSPLTATSQLTVSNVTDLAGNLISANSSVSLSLSQTSLGSGLLATYYDQNGVSDAYFTGNTVKRVDSMLYFDWSGDAPSGGFATDHFTARWSGLILLPTSGTYSFKVEADDMAALAVNGSTVISPTQWGGTATVSGLSAGTYATLTVDFYEFTGGAGIKLSWIPPGSSSYVTVPVDKLYHCVKPSNTLGSFLLTTGSTSVSTCATPPSVQITAVDTNGETYTGYTGTITLSTSTAHGTWSAASTPAPSGTLNSSTSNNGAATYQFAAGDAGIVTLNLSETTAQTVVVTAQDTNVPGSASTSSSLEFLGSSFVFGEDAANKIAGSNVVVAGRPHDVTVSLVKRSSGACSVATDYTGSRSLKLWRTDSNGSWTTPTLISPALSIPSSPPSSDNVVLTFNAGVASFNVGTTDIGRYSLTVHDDTATYSSGTISGTSNTLTVRPFAIVVQGLKRGSTDNPGGSAASEAVFGMAGSSFQATIGAYRWSSAMTANGADANDDGVPDSSATLAATISGGLAPSFSSTVTLSPLTGSQTPSGGTLGTLSNGSVTSLTGGTATPTTLSYSEVGSFTLATTGVVSNFLGSGQSLDATVFNSTGTQSNRIGRFTPASFAASNTSLTHRADLSCPSGNAFTYLNENFQLKFTLTARNTSGATTTNYVGAFAKLDPTSAAAWQLGGIAGSTAFLGTGSSQRLSLGTAIGSWSNGVASGVTLTAAVPRNSAPDGPFSASFGIAPVDSDGITMASFDLDADSSISGNDHTALATVALRFGRLRLQNVISSRNRLLYLPLSAQYWNGTNFATNTLDSCTSVSNRALNFGNHQGTVTPADSIAQTASSSLSAGTGFVVLAQFQNGHRGTFDVALSLGSSATDNSCLQPWTPYSNASESTVGAGLAYLRGAWCGGSYDRDPSARVAVDLYRDTNKFLFQRENH